MADPLTNRVRTTGSTRDAVREHFNAETRNAEKIKKHDLGLSDDEELPPYEHQEYPKAMHHADGSSVIANNQDEEDEHQQSGFHGTLADAQAEQENGDDESDEPDFDYGDEASSETGETLHSPATEAGVRNTPKSAKPKKKTPSRPSTRR